MVDKIEKKEMGGVCSTFGGKESFIQDFGGEIERKGALRRIRRSWLDNIKMDF